MLSLLEYNATLFRSHNETIYAGSHFITVCQFTYQLLPEITATAPTQRAVAEPTRTQSFIVRLFTVGDRAFNAAAARIWNSLPSTVTAAETPNSFKKHF